MRITKWLFIPVMALAAAAGCSSTDSDPGNSGSATSAGAGSKVMPNVTGKKLDVAEDAIQSAGGDPDKVKEIGGGALGIVVKSNWTVCSQVPAAGKALPAAPQLTVARSCSTATSTSSSPASSSAGSSSAPATTTPLTVKNNKDFAKLLKVGDGCDAPVSAFASKYEGRQIEFDGSISNLQKHEDYDTRYDILIGPGDDGGNTAVGPNLQFEDVNTTSDLHYKGAVPDSIGVGTKLHVVAEVGEYTGDNSCFLRLTPVSTQVR